MTRITKATTTARLFAASTCGLLVAMLSLADTHAQKPPSPADLAERISGTWTINLQLSPGFRAPSGKPGGPGRGGSPMFAMAGGFGQRGGSRGAGGDLPTGPGDLSPAELAAQAAMRQLQQIADQITIAATPERVSFNDVRGERTYPIDGKSTKITVGTAEVSVKSKWDKATLKQEFSTAQSKLTQTWNVDADGRLVLVAKVESLRLVTPDQRAVFDRR